MWFEITFIIISSLQLLHLIGIYQWLGFNEEKVEPISDQIKYSLYSWVLLRDYCNYLLILVLMFLIVLYLFLNFV
jgi:hypothetical protein